jgi:hypothetical protein
METRAPEPDEFHRQIQREFEIRYLRSRGTAFQDFFSDIMEAAFGTDFFRVRPHGAHGDFKADGYRQSGKTVYQVYGPEDLRNLRRLLAKIDDDFHGAKAHWVGQIRQWIFVHNVMNGLPAQAIQMLEGLRAESPPIEIECWGFEQLWGVARTIDRDHLRRLFPNSGTPNVQPDPVLISRTQRELYWRSLYRTLRHSLLIPQRDKLPRFNTPFRLCYPQELHLYEHHQDLPKGAIPINKRETPTHIDLLSLRSVLHKHRRILIEGEAGSGKSTLLRKFARRELVYLLRQRRRLRTRGKTPVIVDLRLVDNNHSIDQLILASIAQTGVSLAPSDVQYLQRRGYLTLLLDGLDEVSATARVLCVQQIERLANDCPQCGIVVTSRPYPNTSLALTRLSIVPIANEDIIHAFSQAAGGKKNFKQKFNGVDPSTYVQHHLSSELLRLSRWPLTLQMVLDVVAREGKPPGTLFDLYERFVLWRFHWEESHARATSLSSYIAAGETLATLASRQKRAPLMTEWIDALASTLGIAKDSRSSEHEYSEDIAKRFLASGMCINDFGNVRFMHKSFEEFFAAKYVLRISALQKEEPSSRDLSVCRFLCGAVEDFSSILVEQLEQCEDVKQLLPLLEECKARGREGGVFEDLYHAIFFAQELGVELCYGMYGSRNETFVEEIRDLVKTCIGIGPKAISILRTAASEILNGTPFAQSREWFVVIVDGLATMGWSGTSLHRSLLEAGFFDHPESFSIDGSGSESAEMKKETNYHALCEYMMALDKDDFAAASKSLRFLRRALVRKPRARRSRSIDPDQRILFTPPS